MYMRITIGSRRRSILRTSRASSWRRSSAGRCLRETGGVLSFWRGTREENVCLEEEEDKDEESGAGLLPGFLASLAMVDAIFAGLVV